MPFRLLADDGSVHVFPPETRAHVMNRVVGQYSTALAQQQARAGSTVDPTSPDNPAPSSAPTPVVFDLGPNSGLVPPHRGVCLGNVNDFMKAHLADARRLAAMLPPGSAPQDVLAVSANESEYGGPKGFAKYGNYFGLHDRGNGPFPGQTGTYTTTGSPPAQVPTFAPSTGYMDSGRAFVNLEAPHLQGQDLSRPQTFFEVIHDNGYGRGKDREKYVPRLTNIYGLFGNCLRNPLP